MDSFKENLNDITIVENYGFVKETTEKEINFSELLERLTKDTSGNLRRSLWLNEKSFLKAIDLEGATEEERESYSTTIKTLTGQHPYGLNFGFVAARDDRNNPANLFFIENIAGHKLLVIGSCEISPALGETLKKTKIEYINKGSSAADEKINDFLMDTMKEQYALGIKYDQGEVVPNLINAFCQAASQETVPTLATIGSIIVESSFDNVQACTRVIKNKP